MTNSCTRKAGDTLTPFSYEVVYNNLYLTATIFIYIFVSKIRGSAICIATGCGLDDREVGV
jgi:hypothetical protein